MSLWEDITFEDVMNTADRFITTPQEEQQMEYEKQKRNMELRLLEKQLTNQLQEQQPSNAEYTSGGGGQTGDPTGSNNILGLTQNQLLLGGLATVGLLVVMKD